MSQSSSQSITLRCDDSGEIERRINPNFVQTLEVNDHAEVEDFCALSSLGQISGYEMWGTRMEGAVEY
jgi:hypothetical protein